MFHDSELFLAHVGMFRLSPPSSWKMRTEMSIEVQGENRQVVKLYEVCK